MAKRTLSAEIRAMARIEAAMDGLAADVQKRVIGWAFDRWDPENKKPDPLYPSGWWPSSTTTVKVPVDWNAPAYVPSFSVLPNNGTNTPIGGAIR